MTEPKLQFYGAFFFLPQTKNDFNHKVSLLNSVRNWINTIESLKGLKFKMSSRTISVQSENISIRFDNSDVFKFHVASKDVNVFERVNTICNEILLKFNNNTLANEKQLITVVASAHFVVNEKSNLFSRIIQTNALKELECPGETFNPVKLDLNCIDTQNKQRVRFSLFKGGKENSFDASVERKLENPIAQNLLTDSISFLKKRSNNLAKTIIEEP